MKRSTISRLLSCALLLTLLCAALAGCGGKRKFSLQEIGLFNSFVIITGYCENETEFSETAEMIIDELEACDALFDIYAEHDGMNSLRTVNRLAGKENVAVDDRIIGLLEFGMDVYEMTGGKVNIMMGSVLTLWHEARTADNGMLPDEAALNEAARHTDMSLLQVNGNEVYISDPQASLDVGALAKGYAARLVSDLLPDGWLLNLGGNIYAGGAHGGELWKVGIQSPDDANEYAAVLKVENTAVVTSGDYQRYFTVGGKRYSHIIDSETLYPADKWRSVTVITEDAALADALSTALFLIDRDEGTALLDKFGASAVWIDADGSMYIYGEIANTIS